MLCLLPCLLNVFAVEPQSKPNLLLITVDTTRADHLGCYGHQGGSSPNLDKLAAEGVVFTDAHAHVPLTLPSHANILTGRLPSTLNLRVNDLQLKKGTPTLAVVLKSMGYKTIAVVSSQILDRSHGLVEGFDVYDDIMKVGPMPGSPPIEKIAEDATAKALTEMKKIGSAHFFLWVHYYDPHYSYRAPEPFGQKYSQSPYDGEIAYMDSQIGILLNELGKAGMMDNTIVAVAGDHGEALSEFGESQHGVFIYEPVMRVPLLLKWKGHLPQGRRIAGLSGLTDLAPTVCELMGIPGWKMDGQSLAGSIEKGSVEPGRDLYMESYHGYFAYGWAPLRGIITGRYKYIQAPKPELYEWRVTEKNNLAGSNPAEMKELSGILKNYPEADQGEKAQIDKLLTDPSNEESLKQLVSLGYLSGLGQSPGQKGLLDPKDAISFDDQMSKAKDMMETGKMQEGMDILLQILKVNPTNNSALSLLGNAYMQAGDLEKARVCFEEELKLKPQLEKAHLNLGTIFEKQGIPDLAIREYKAAIAISPRFPEAISGLGQILMNQMKYAELETLAGKAVEDGIESSDIYFQLGVALATQSKLERAKWAFAKSLSLNPLRPLALANLGRIAFEQGNYDEAISYYDRALRLDARNASYLFMTGSLYLEGKKDKGKAIIYYKKALQADPYGPYAASLRELIVKLESGQPD